MFHTCFESMHGIDPAHLIPPDKWWLVHAAGLQLSGTMHHVWWERCRLTPDDALAYLREVKKRFQGKSDVVYDTFLDIMKEFKSGG
jgi:hypothetical protein